MLRAKIDANIVNEERSTNLCMYVCEVRRLFIELLYCRYSDASKFCEFLRGLNLNYCFLWLK